MKDFIIVPSQAEDVLELKDNLRAEDIAECEAGGLTPFNALLDSYVFSDECYSCKKDNKTIAMFGVSSWKQPEGIGVIWFLGSDETEKHPVSMVRDSREFIDNWFNKYELLWNTVDIRNTRHIAWLKHLGFTFVEPTIKFNNYDFLQFYKRRQ